ncbi:MAG: DUF1015 family protein [Eubacteriales bacterium]|nr:DUF1015 family protein [Eubacteriales bacterium]MDD4390620.1 DUF1015 family protein [Eubacteriales bacterium]
MATLRPFRAIRPAAEYASNVISLPYDVMNREEAAAMTEGNSYSFLHICRAEIDLPEQSNPYDKQVYEKAKANIEDNLSKGVFLREEKPMLYIYRQTMDGRAQTGIVGCVSVDEYMNDGIKKHEFTRVEKELDRINHFDICNANTEPVFLTYRDELRIRTIVEGYISSHEPVYDILTGDGVSHILWCISDDEVIDSISGLFKDVPALYIADGHHRSASACKVGLKRREENSGYTGDEEFNFFMAAVFPDSDLKIFDYNRVVKDLNGLDSVKFIDAIKNAGFEVEKKGNDIYKPEQKGAFGMYIDGEWYKLKAKDEIVPSDVIGSLDVSILQERVLSPILNINDPRTDTRIDFVGGIRGLKELERRCNHDMKVAFAIYPAAIEDLLSVADQNKVMPPKSTWFEPKLGSGLFMHEL